MLKLHSSAWTAAQKSSNCSLLLRPALIATILMLAAGLLLSSCNQSNLRHETQKIAFTKGWIKGANFIDSCHYAKSLNAEIAKLRLYKDSVEFAKFIDNIK